MLELPVNYSRVMAKIAAHGGILFGIRVTDNPLLRDLVRIAYELSLLPRSKNTLEAQERIKNLVKTALASTYTFNSGDLETGENFPNSMSLLDLERWWLGFRYTEKSPTDPEWATTSQEALEGLTPGRYDAESIRDLETQLGARIGDCAMYAITLGILMASTGAWKRVILHGKPPHAWVCVVTGKVNALEWRIDLAMESHGHLESEYQESLKADETAKDAIEYDLTSE